MSAHLETVIVPEKMKCRKISLATENVQSRLRNSGLREGSPSGRRNIQFLPGVPKTQQKELKKRGNSFFLGTEGMFS